MPFRRSRMPRLSIDSHPCDLSIRVDSETFPQCANFRSLKYLLVEKVGNNTCLARIDSPTKHQVFATVSFKRSPQSFNTHQLRPKLKFAEDIFTGGVIDSTTLGTFNDVLRKAIHLLFG